MSRYTRPVASLAAVTIAAAMPLAAAPSHAATPRTHQPVAATGTTATTTPALVTYEELAATILTRPQVASALRLPKPKGWLASPIQGSVDDTSAALLRSLTNDKDTRSPYEDLIVSVSDWGDAYTARTQIEAQLAIAESNGATVQSRSDTRLVMHEVTSYQRHVVNVWGLHGRWRSEGTCGALQSEASTTKLTRCVSKLQRAQYKRSAHLFTG